MWRLSRGVMREISQGWSLSDQGQFSISVACKVSQPSPHMLSELADSDFAASLETDGVRGFWLTIVVATQIRTMHYPPSV